MGWVLLDESHEGCASREGIDTIPHDHYQNSTLVMKGHT